MKLTSRSFSKVS